MLPPELVDTVASFLRPNDLFALRQTCKALYQETLSVFWRTCCQRIETTLSPQSLHDLEAAIARHPQYRQHVRHLSMAGFDQFCWVPDDAPPWYNGYDDGQDHRQLFERLHAILKQLVNCHSFGIPSITASDHPRNSHVTKPPHAIPIILDILAEPSLPVSSFTVEFHILHNIHDPEHRCYNRLDPHRFRLATVDKPRFLAVWEHLRTLTLTLDCESCHVVLDWAADLILHAPVLQSLDLTCALYDMEEPAAFTRHLASPLLQPLHDPSSLCSNLQDLRINFLTASVADLTAFLRRCRRTLRVLKLEHLWLHESIIDDLPAFFRSLKSNESSRHGVDGGGFVALQTIHFIRIQIRIINGKLRARFPALLENPVVDEVRGVRFVFPYEHDNNKRMPRDCWVEFSDQSCMYMDVALEMMADTMEIQTCGFAG